MTDGETPLPFPLYDRQGNRIQTAEELSRLSGDPNYKRVAGTYVFQTLPWPKGCVWISTVWLSGVDHNVYGGPPVIFETMLWPKPAQRFPEWDQMITDRYSTEADALAGHHAAVQMVREQFRWPVLAHSARALYALLAASAVGALLGLGLLCLIIMELIVLIS